VATQYLNRLNHSAYLCVYRWGRDKERMKNEKEVQLTNTLNTAHERAVALLMNEITISEERDFLAVSSLRDTLWTDPLINSL
jgi:hypothetical protein